MNRAAEIRKLHDEIVLPAYFTTELKCDFAKENEMKIYRRNNNRGDLYYLLPLGTICTYDIIRSSYPNATKNDLDVCFDFLGEGPSEFTVPTTPAELAAYAESLREWVLGPVAKQLPHTKGLQNITESPTGHEIFPPTYFRT